MKRGAIIGVLLAQSLLLSAQAFPEVLDTIPSWIVYVDSVRMFAAAPDYDLRLEVAPGWVVQRKVFGPWNVEVIETYYDTDGVKFNTDIVLFTHRRKIVYNKFRQ
jgi:hypothetical protein